MATWDSPNTDCKFRSRNQGSERVNKLFKQRTCTAITHTRASYSFPSNNTPPSAAQICFLLPLLTPTHNKKTYRTLLYRHFPRIPTESVMEPGYSQRCFPTPCEIVPTRKQLPYSGPKHLNAKLVRVCTCMSHILHQPSDETNWPTSAEDPLLCSWNVTSDTIMLSSKTIPQSVQTASPRVASYSIFVPPHCEQTLTDIVHCHYQLATQARRNHRLRAATPFHLVMLTVCTAEKRSVVRLGLIMLHF